MPRPTFYYKDQPVRATGLLPYVNVNGVIYFLFRQTKKQKYMWSDIGGKTDKKDKTIRDTLIREVTEETNNQYNLKKCIDFSKITARLYHNKSKYLLHLIREDKRFSGYHYRGLDIESIILEWLINIDGFRSMMC